MPLRDHFHSPLAGLRHWESFHTAWATEINYTPSFGQWSCAIPRGGSWGDSYWGLTRRNGNPLSPQVSEEELDRRAKSTVWYSTEEVLAHLKRLANS